jgi:asparagine synthase (glutamine-hydrolysing)
MCGFAGIMNYTEEPQNERNLHEMSDVIRHRGPDDEGFYLDGRVGFAFRRLSVIDIEGGHQPMSKEKYVIVYNGEIYNYKIIRKELERCGYCFATQSDTEVVLTAYCEWGVEALSKFNGVWALAIWDKEEKTLFLSRDRVGVKPLYWARTKEKLFFSSEIKAVLEAGFPAEINNANLAEFFHFGHMSGAATMFKNVYALLPGTWMKASRDGSTDGRYWDVGNDAVSSSCSENETKKEVLDLLTDSVRFQLISDVPVGTLLSGGVDSSLLSLIANGSMDEDTLRTYCMKMAEAEYDESKYAQEAAIVCGSMHHTVSVSKEDYINLLPYVAWLHDEPINFSNALYMLCVCQHARKDNTKVLLSGEGADELFGGYLRYSKTLKRVIESQNGFSRKELSVLGSAVYGFDKVRRLIGTVEWENPWRTQCYERFQNLPERDLLMRMDQRTRLVSLLYRQDRMSMGVGVETRVPFLDHRLIELANCIPAKFKFTENDQKILLKNVALNMGFTQDAICRPKVGFPTPVEDWIRQNELCPFVDYIGRGDSSASEYYDINYARRLMEENHDRRGNHDTILWLLLSFEIWARVFVDKTLDVKKRYEL